MKPSICPTRQHGATLVIGLIMLVLITLMVISAFTMSSTNLKLVGNMQAKEEASAAANAAIEEVISSATVFESLAGVPLADRVAPEPIQVGNYEVAVAVPECVYSTEITDNTSGDQNPNILNQSAGTGGTVGTVGFRNTFWDIRATVNDPVTGASVEVHQGIRVALPALPDPCI